MALSAMLKRSRHECRVAIGSSIREFKPLLEKWQPDIVGFSLMSGLHLWANGIVEAIRDLHLAKQPFIIYGGPHPTFFPEILERSKADAICIGEGDEAIVDLANAIDHDASKSQILNLHVKEEGRIHRNPVRDLVDLDTLPFPDRSLYYDKSFFRTNPTKPFVTGRGCPYNCSFCYNKSIRDIYHGRGRFVRSLSPARAVQEVLEVKQQWGMRTVYFFDDTFGLNKKWALELMDIYKKEVRLPFICRIRANSADEEMISAFKEAGCVSVFFAVETATDRLREELLRKRITNDDIYRTAALLRKYKIKFLTYNMVGIPEQTIDEAFDTIRMNAEIGTSYPWCSIFNPYPGTELAEYCKRKGYLDENFGPDDLATTYHNSSIVEHGNQDEVANLHKFFQLGVWIPSLLPLIRKLVKWKPNILFSLVFSATYFINVVRSERFGLLHTLRLAWHNMSLFLGTSRRKAAVDESELHPD